MAYEDFTSYTEFDEGGEVTVESATKVSWVGLHPRGNTAYLYKDKGANYFNGDFTHKFEIQFSVVGNLSWTHHWMLANLIGDVQDVLVASGDAYTLITYDDSEQIHLRIYENGSFINDGWAAPGPQPSTTYYIEIVRDDDGGANSTGRITAYIRTGSHTGVLRDTLVVDCSAGEQNDFRYVYALASKNDSANASTVTGFTQNLDLGVVTPPGWTGKIIGITNPTKIMGIPTSGISKVIGI